MIRPIKLDLYTCNFFFHKALITWKSGPISIPQRKIEEIDKFYKKNVINIPLTSALVLIRILAFLKRMEWTRSRKIWWPVI